jgi:FeS assembly protein SufD
MEENYVESVSKSLNEPDWLSRFRFEALDAFITLPEEQSNLYTKYALDIPVDFARWSKTKDSRSASSSLPIAELASGMETGQYFVTNQTETIASKNIKNLESKGVIFCDLNEALEKHESILKRVFSDKAIKPHDDKYAALNSALLSSGWLVYLPKNTILETPLRVRSYLSSFSPSFSQTWIVAEENSQGSLITEEYGAEVPTVSSSVDEVYVQDNSSFHFANIQDYSQETTVLTNRKAICNKDSRITWTLASFGGKAQRSRLDSVFAKDGASAEVVEVVFGSNSQRFDLVSDLTHIGQHTKGRILSNSVLKDNSRSIFKGMIRIGKDAKNANAYLAGHGILLSPNAKSDAIPGLEILTNEVKATHSASVAQIDLDQIFYMMTRGLSEDEAKKFIVLGFLEPAISRISSEELRDRIRDLVEAKWHGETGFVKRKKKEVLFEEEAQENKPSQDIFEGHYKYR